MKAINLTSDEKNRLIKEIQDFFYTERDEQIGVIAAEVVLDFFLETLSKTIYNKSLIDTKNWFTEHLENLDADFDLLYK